MSKQFHNIKVEAISKNQAKRAAYRINRMCFKGRFANCYITEVGEDHYTVTLFIDECEEVKKAHESKVAIWTTVVKQQLQELNHEH